ncbi:hypothetical protein [Salinarimonas ramus]|uniref:Uncharacterized protein n=1 Tax=Salinarimonas ramus TaxID=690164 RepID=A0A917V460_9HYPH|nr:hypothetical protein [Salinarimonas ramus]GGK35101.1 hypothetical protein GCM10011322_22370 [Salinarimonas ramus]
MAYALDTFGSAARNAGTAATETPRPGLFTRVLRRMQEAQLERVRRELRLYAPHLEARMENEGVRKVSLSDDARLPFVR